MLINIIQHNNLPTFPGEYSNMYFFIPIPQFYAAIRFTRMIYKTTNSAYEKKNVIFFNDEKKKNFYRKNEIKRSAKYSDKSTARENVIKLKINRKTMRYKEVWR